MIKTKSLIQARCSQQFAKAAMLYSPMYKDDIEFFIQEVDEVLGASSTARQFDPSDSDYSDSGCYRHSMDLDIRMTERDYTGDLLNYYR